MDGMIFRPFRKQNSSQKNTKTVYSEYSYSGIVPKERALSHAQSARDRVLTTIHSRLSLDVYLFALESRDSSERKSERKKRTLMVVFFSINSATEENNKLKARYEQAKEEVENLVSKMKRLTAITRSCVLSSQFSAFNFTEREH